MNQDLLKRSLGYHGQQLVNFFKETPGSVGNLDLDAIDYRVYQSRSRELLMEDRGKRLLLHRFIAQNAQALYAHPVPPPPASLVSPEGEGEVTSLPPVETFLPLASSNNRSIQFFELVDQQDVLFCKVAAKNASGFLLTVLCFSPIMKKSRYVEDLRLKCFCPVEELELHDNLRMLEAGDSVCVVVLEVKREAQRLLVSMKKDKLSTDMANRVKLGLTEKEDLPETLDKGIRALERDHNLGDLMRKDSKFANPSSINILAQELGLCQKSNSLFKCLNEQYHPDVCSQSLRKRQNAKWAYKHVASGIKYFKAGNNIEAFQCLNQALKIDEDNVEALVARGALYANNGNLDKAVSDFELALKLNPDHKNARKYLCETLIAVARAHEDGSKLVKAEEVYKQILEVVPGYPDAIEGLRQLARKSQATDMKEKLNILMGTAKAKSRSKSRRARSSSTSSSSSSSSSGSRSRSRSRKKKKSKRHSRSPSPPQRKKVDLDPSLAAAVGIPLMSTDPLSVVVKEKSVQEKEYDKAVEEFLRKTQADPRPSSKARSRTRADRKASRSRSRDRSRRRHTSRDHKKSKKKRHSSSSESDDEASKKRNKKKRKRQDSDHLLQDRSIQELTKMGYGDNMDVDAFAEKLSAYIRNKKKDESGAGPSSAATSASKPDPNHIYVEGLNIKVKELKPSQENKREATPPLPRASSPSVRAMFDVQESSSQPRTAATGGKSMWKPIGKDSLQHRLGSAIKSLDKTEDRRRYQRQPLPEFKVEFDPKLGMFKRKYKSPEPKASSPEPQERRMVRRVSRSPSRSRSRSRDRDYDSQRSFRYQMSSSDRDLRDMISESEKLRKEREMIEREKKLLLAQQDSTKFRPRSRERDNGPPYPAPSSHSGFSSNKGGYQGSTHLVDNVMTSVLAAVDAPKAKEIIPGTNSFDELESYINNAKKQRIDQMKERNKDYRRNKMW